MPLRAKLNSKDVYAYEFNENSWNELKATYKKQTLMMSCCDNKAIPKVSKLNNYFFAHARRGLCTSAPETFEHIFLKTLIAKIASSLGWNVMTEKVGETPEGDRWIADVFCTKEKTKIAFEIQWSSQTEIEFKRRQEKYIRSGIRTAWLYKLRHNQEYFPTNYETPAFGIQYKKDSNEMHVPQFNQTIDDFVRGMLSGKLKWKPHDGEELTGQLITYVQQCWKCKRNTRVILGIGFYDKDRTELELAGFHEDGIPEFILQQISNSALAKNGIGSIKNRYHKTMGEAYISNGCRHCEAIQGTSYYFDAWVEYAYTGSLGEPMMEFLFENSQETFHIEGKWYYGRKSFDRAGNQFRRRNVIP
ncbi:MAG: competence protein CoiA family protein [Candidatus Poribacteria bacterium]|nr:competence protein CoiA family protein [Candidatus Poribacteria bacterium]